MKLINFVLVLISFFRWLLTLKAPLIICSRRQCQILSLFQNNKIRHDTSFSCNIIPYICQKLGMMSQNLSSAAVVIGTLRFKVTFLKLYNDIWYKLITLFDLNSYPAEQIYMSYSLVYFYLFRCMVSINTVDSEVAWKTVHSDAGSTPTTVFRGYILVQQEKRERSGSVVEGLTRDREAAGLSFTGVTALSSLSKKHLS